MKQSNTISFGINLKQLTNNNMFQSCKKKKKVPRTDEQYTVYCVSDGIEKRRPIQWTIV